LLQKHVTELPLDLLLMSFFELKVMVMQLFVFGAESQLCNGKMKMIHVLNM